MEPYTMLARVGDAAKCSAKCTVRFLKQHKRAVILGSAAGVAVAGYWKLRQLVREAEELQKQLQTRAREEQCARVYLNRARTECMVAILNFLPTLRRRLFTAIDVTGPVRELKALRRGGVGAGAEPSSESSGESSSGEEDPREQQLWDQVKVANFCRLVTALYAFNALNLMLRMQLHILGRYSYLESKELAQTLTEAGATVPSETAAALAAGSGSPAGPPGEAPGQAGMGKLSMAARHTVLSSTYEYLLGDGLRALSAEVGGALERVMASWHVQSKLRVECDELVQVLRDVRTELERDQSEGSRQSCLIRYMVNPQPEGVPGGEAGGGIAQEDAAVRQTLNETWDAVESPNFSLALQASLNATFDIMCRHLREKAFTPPSPPRPSEGSPTSATSGNSSMGCAARGEEHAAVDGAVRADPTGSDAGSLPHAPLATVISQIKLVVAEILDPAEANEYIVAVGALSTVNGLCCSIFDQFGTT